jgi:hypothetical protein
MAALSATLILCGARANTSEEQLRVATFDFL